MIRKSDLIDVSSQQKKHIEASQTYNRELLQELKIIENFALIISGIRRCGKSTLIAQLIKKQKSKWFFINFDTPKLFGFEFSDFAILDEIINENKNTKLLFFDEIQIIEGWELYVRGKLDEGFRVIITGSNASMLSRELGTKLTGRHITKELFPFSFQEFCGYKSLLINNESFLNYMTIGGFPQYIETEEQDILVNLINDIIYRDIAVRHNIRDEKPLQNLLMFLAANIGNLTSANKIKQLIGVKSTATVQEYLSFLSNAYLIHLLSKFTYSYKSQLVNPRKIYFIDNGLHNAISPSFTKDTGRKLENVVFWEIRRRYHEVYYFTENSRECDFIVCMNKKPVKLIQVCIELNNENIKREINGLEEAMNFFDMNEGTIITLDQKDSIHIQDKTIKVLPAYEINFDNLLEQ